MTATYFEIMTDDRGAKSGFGESGYSKALSAMICNDSKAAFLVARKRTDLEIFAVVGHCAGLDRQVSRGCSRCQRWFVCSRWFVF